MNIFDAFLVLLNFLELIVLPFWDAGNAPELSTNHIRLIKLTRVARTLRVVKTLSMLRQLRHLVATCIASIGALFWSLILLLFLKLIFALMISQTLQIFIQNSDENYEARLLMNTWYGTFSRSMYTFFEITYSGGWPLLVRPVLESVSAWYAIPFLIYVTLVVFATLRIVTALFLKETLSTAANDAEMVIEDSRRFALQYQKKLEDWVEVTCFKVVDYVGGVWYGMLHMYTVRIYTREWKHIGSYLETFRKWKVQHWMPVQKTTGFESWTLCLCVYPCPVSFSNSCTPKFINI